MPKIYTVGYGKRSFADLTNLLMKHIRVPIRVIDVRISRKSFNKHFSVSTTVEHKTLENKFACLGIWYTWILELGNPTKKYDDFTIEGTVADNYMRGLINRSIVCPDITVLMCAETDYHQCHRRKVAHWFKQNVDWKIIHLK